MCFEDTHNQGKMTTLVYLLSAYLLHDAELYFNIFLAIWQISVSSECVSTFKSDVMTTFSIPWPWPSCRRSCPPGGWHDHWYSVPKVPTLGLWSSWGCGGSCSNPLILRVAGSRYHCSPLRDRECGLFLRKLWESLDFPRVIIEH